MDNGDVIRLTNALDAIVSLLQEQTAILKQIMELQLAQAEPVIADRGILP